MKKDKKPEDSILVDAAKAIGRTAGKVVTLVGAGQPEAKKASHKGKLVKKNKHRLPRRQKKAQLKAKGNQPG